MDGILKIIDRLAKLVRSCAKIKFFSLQNVTL